MSERGRRHRDIIEDLEGEGKHSDALLLAWSIIEMHCNNILLRAYGLSTHNPKSEWLTGLWTSTQLRLLKRMELLSDREFNDIQQFKEIRNGLDHKDGLFFPNYSEAQKRELINKATAAVDVTHDLSDRMLNLPSPMFGIEHWAWKELEKFGKNKPRRRKVHSPFSRILSVI